MHRPITAVAGRWLALLLLPVFALAPLRAQPRPVADALGVAARHLSAEFWIGRLHDAEQVRLSPAQTAALNAQVVARDPSVHDLEALPARLSRAELQEWLAPLARPPQAPRYDARGRRLDAAALAPVRRNANLAALRATRARYGLVVRRADLRTWPTRQRVFARPGEHDLDRWQESALFPGTPVVVLHTSRDARWFFVVSPRYAAWIERDAVALGEREAVFGYGRRTPFLVVTGATVQTVFNPEVAGVSALSLEMGVRVPLRADWPADQAVHGQLPFAAHVVELPVRAADGGLAFQPALIPRQADVRAGYLPHSAANVIAQGFKFLGERYGWGHADGGRDCSGFVSEVYMSLGLQLPRNTGDQGRSEVFDRLALAPDLPSARRSEALAAARPGDLLYLPGHVMMVLGREDGLTFVIHDTAGVGVRDATGRYRRLPLNQVAVTPLEPLLDEREVPLVESIYALVRLRPAAARE